MLTHTIRALSLIGLIVIAHALRPFSLGNVAAFSSSTFHSFSLVLPEAAAARLAQAGGLVRLLGGGWGEKGNLIEHLADQVSPNARAVNQRPGSAGKAARRFEYPVRGLQAHRRTGSGMAPLPVIPGLESSLIPNLALMALPPSPSAVAARGQDAQQLFQAQPKSLNPECEWRPAFEKQPWLPAEFLLQLQEAQAPLQNIKLRIFNQRASNGLACPKSGKATGSQSGTGKRSC